VHFRRFSGSSAAAASIVAEAGRGGAGVGSGTWTVALEAFIMVTDEAAVEDGPQ